MDELRLAEAFEDHRDHLRSVAYRMLGSTAEADDAVQDVWLRLSRAETSDVENLGGWLTTVTARVCLNVLRSRRTRREDSLDIHLPDPVVTSESSDDPASDAVLADSVGLALLVVLEMLSPAERLAFVLHDMFAVPFEEIAVIVDRSPAATRQLASRARRRVQGAAPGPDADIGRQRQVVDAFFAAARAGDFDALVEILDPDVVTRTDAGSTASSLVRGATAVASRALSYADPRSTLHPVLVNGAAGVVVTVGARPVAVLGFTVRDDRVVAIDSLSDQARISRLDLAELLSLDADEQ